ncbi:MAG: hypothetical protein QJR14_00490 [Bacillota bacterium]|nr:hypothetical protein [Bacillota bacterium]
MGAMDAQPDQENRERGAGHRPLPRPRRAGEGGEEPSAPVGGVASAGPGGAATEPAAALSPGPAQEKRAVPEAPGEPGPDGPQAEGDGEEGGRLRAPAAGGAERSSGGPGRRTRRPLRTLRWEELTQELRGMHAALQALEQRTEALVELAELARLLVTKPEEVVSGLRALAEQLERSDPPAGRPVAAAGGPPTAGRAEEGDDPLAELLRSPQVRRTLSRLLGQG